MTSVFSVDLHRCGVVIISCLLFQRAHIVTERAKVGGYSLTASRDPGRFVGTRPRRWFFEVQSQRFLRLLHWVDR